MRTTLQDLRYSIRMLGRERLFTAMALITLALGIGANSAIFVVVNAVLLRPLPYRDPARIMLIEEAIPKLTREGIQNIAEFSAGQRRGQAVTPYTCT